MTSREPGEGPPPVRAAQTLRNAGLRPRKSLGQNFLTDPTFPPRIADAAHVEPSDLVLEVGPGLGVLTAELAARLDATQGGRLVAVELDGNLVPLLREKFAARPEVAIVHADVLQMDPAKLTGGRAYKLVANLPYYITSAVLRHFLESEARPLSLTVMVQREVAQRIVARPPDMSLLAVAVQFYGKPAIAFRVPSGAFHPAPKVESAVVSIDVYPPERRPVSPPDVGRFFAVVRAGFGQKRKQLANTLSAGLGLPKDAATERLRAAGVAPERRAETLSLEEWARVAERLP